MAVKIGDIDIAREIIDLHFQLRRTQLLLERALQRISTNENSEVLTQEDMQATEEEAITYLQERFPKMGIKRKTL